MQICLRLNEKVERYLLTRAVFENISLEKALMIVLEEAAAKPEESISKEQKDQELYKAVDEAVDFIQRWVPVDAIHTPIFLPAIYYRVTGKTCSEESKEFQALLISSFNESCQKEGSSWAVHSDLCSPLKGVWAYQYIGNMRPEE
jgi:hypothetical protein